MNGPMFPNIRRLHRRWARAVLNLAWSQWTFMSAGLRMANRMMEPATAAAPTTSSEVEDLTRLAEERTAKGLAPPREIYQAPYRSQIDWSRFPEWAWPTDPEAFEGCCHEG